MLDLAISSRLDNESEPVVTRPNMGTLLKLERAFKLESAPEALRTPKLEHLAWLAWESRRPRRANVGKVLRLGRRPGRRERERHPFSRRGVAYELAALAIATRQPISELQNADPRIIRALKAILKEQAREREKAARRR